MCDFWQVRDIVYVHSNLKLADKLQDMMYTEDNVPWSCDDSDSETDTEWLNLFVDLVAGWHNYVLNVKNKTINKHICVWICYIPIILGLYI